MSERVAKIENQLRQLVSIELPKLLEPKQAVAVTVTRVDVAPDLRNANVWLGLLGSESSQNALWQRLIKTPPALQAALSGQLSIRYVPKLELKRDTGGEYAAHIDQLMRGL